jgi:hypothetical protein
MAASIDRQVSKSCLVRDVERHVRLSTKSSEGAAMNLRPNGTMPADAPAPKTKRPVSCLKRDKSSSSDMAFRPNNGLPRSGRAGSRQDMRRYYANSRDLRICLREARSRTTDRETENGAGG